MIAIMGGLSAATIKRTLEAGAMDGTVVIRAQAYV
jgi:hypothetical protein